MSDITKIILINMIFIFIVTIIPLIIGIVRTIYDFGGSKNIKTREDVCKIYRMDPYVKYWILYIKFKIILRDSIIFMPISFLLYLEEEIALAISRMVIEIKKRNKRRVKDE